MKGKHYTATFTQPSGGGSTADAFAIGTAQKAANPVTAMSAPGESCNAYAAQGSYYCYGSALAAGQAIVFQITVQAVVATSGWQACCSPDNLVTNNCNDVKTSLSPEQLAARSAVNDVNKAIGLEENVLKNTGSGLSDLLGSDEHLHAAHDDIKPYDDNKAGSPAYVAIDAINFAIVADRQAYVDLKAGGQGKADKLIGEAVESKKKARSHLHLLF